MHILIFVFLLISIRIFSVYIFSFMFNTFLLVDLVRFVIFFLIYVHIFMFSYFHFHIFVFPYLSFFFYHSTFSLYSHSFILLPLSLVFIQQNTNKPRPSLFVPLSLCSPDAPTQDSHPPNACSTHKQTTFTDRITSGYEPFLLPPTSHTHTNYSIGTTVTHTHTLLNLTVTHTHTHKPFWHLTSASPLIQTFHHH